jgi:hypothetical protein
MRWSLCGLAGGDRIAVCFGLLQQSQVNRANHLVRRALNATLPLKARVFDVCQFRHTCRRLIDTAKDAAEFVGSAIATAGAAEVSIDFQLGRFRVPAGWQDAVPIVGNPALLGVSAVQAR